MSFLKQQPHVLTARNLSLATSGLMACSMLSGCLIAGYAPGSGGFIWPGGLGLVFLLMIVLWFLLRRR